MYRLRLFFAVLLLAMLSACATPQGVTPPEVRPTGETSSKIESPPLPVSNLPYLDVPALPCAEVVRTEAVTIGYVSESLYSNGAALPKAEGLVCLDSLVDWLKRVPESRWQVTVTGEEGYGFDPLALAVKRQELIKRFFARKGVELKGFNWQAQVGKDEQLELLQVGN